MLTTPNKRGCWDVHCKHTQAICCTKEVLSMQSCTVGRQKMAADNSAE